MANSNEPNLKNCDVEIQADGEMIAWVEIGDARLIMVKYHNKYLWFREDDGIQYGGLGGKTELSAMESLVNTKLTISFMGII